MGTATAPDESPALGSPEEAVEIAEKCGAFEPAFFGEVVMKIKHGGVTSVDVKQTFQTKR